MHIEDIRNYCLLLENVEETFPFGPDTLVYKVNNKIFLLTSLNSATTGFNVKCDPEKAIELRERYACVSPGYHMNKKHWNTVKIDGSVNQQQLKEWILHSYELVSKSAKKK